jgi:RNA polymerase sigma-70 factor (family 1)
MLQGPINKYTDEQLFILVQNEHTIAFEEIYKRFYGYLNNVACRQIDCPYLAEDIVQEVFTSLYKNRQTIELQVSLRSYLTQAIKFKMYNEYRAENVRKAYQQYFFSTTCKNDFANNIDALELKRKIDKVYTLLPEKCRLVFSMSRKGNLTMKDISGQLQISVSTVEKHISKALSIFRENLREYSVN